MTEINPHALGIKYVQYGENTYCFSNLAYSMFGSREYVAEQAIL